MKSKVLSILSIFFILLMVSCSNKNLIPGENPSTETPKDNNVIIKDNEEKESQPSSNENQNNENINAEENSTSIEKEEDKKEVITPIVTNKNVRIYAFNKEELALYYYDTSIEVTDNALVSALTKELQSNLPKESFLALTDKVGITSAKLDEEKSLLSIYFSDSFVDNMILGNSTESGLLSSLICTYGYNYDVENVAIYFKDELYTSLKGELESGAFEVNYSDAKEYKE